MPTTPVSNEHNPAPQAPVANRRNSERQVDRDNMPAVNLTHEFNLASVVSHWGTLFGTAGNNQTAPNHTTGGGPATPAQQ